MTHVSKHKRLKCYELRHIGKCTFTILNGDVKILKNKYDFDYYLRV